MEISFATRKLHRACQDRKSLRRTWGEAGLLVGRRLTELAAFELLANVPTTPPWHRHQLKGDRDDQFAVNVGKSLRLVFEVANDPVPRRADGGIDLNRATAVRILEVVDYHGN
jgi:proteic killer suppression protein